MTRRPRWRCADPTCPAHRWQPVLAVGEYDPVDVACEAIERHWRDKAPRREEGGGSVSTTPTAIETRYAGCRFRSRLEARWAVFFDALHIPWKYEPQGYIVAGQRYLPDFWIGDRDGVWVEVKGELDRDGLAKLAAAAGPDGLPLRLGDDTRPVDMDFGEERGWLDLATPTLLRLLILGDVPDPAGEWVHPLLSLVNGLHVVEQPIAWWTRIGPGLPLVRMGAAGPLGADPSVGVPHGGPFAPLGHNHLVADAYRAARSARFEHGESG